MREHIGLFRGKRIDNGEWVEGSLLKVTLNGKTAHLIFGDNFSFVGNDVKALSHALVDPDTVGECTGLKDKNGKLIFEGDIISTDLERPYLIVEYRDACFMFNCNDGGKDYYDIFMPILDKPHTEYKWGEIIGNIHDNLELLKGGED